MKLVFVIHLLCDIYSQQKLICQLVDISDINISDVALYMGSRIKLVQSPTPQN